MPWFEVFIPAKDENGMNMTLTLEAPNWIGALRTGLSQIGEGQDAISNVMCDIKEDNSIHVTNPNTGRVFKLHEMAGPPGTAAAEKPKNVEPVVEADDAVEAVVTAPPVVEAPAPAPTPAPMKAEKAPPPKRKTGQFAETSQPHTVASSKPAKTDPAVGRQRAAAPADSINVNDVIADIFDATQELQFEGQPDPTQVAERLLDLALEKIPADAGTFYLADINGDSLSFAAVRGPKAKEIQKKKLTVPVGQGIVGLCAQEGLCLVIEDMQNDQRYFAAIADAVGYQPKNTLCASAEKDGRLYGAIQLINAKRGTFTPGEMEVVRYIGLTAADMLERAAGEA